MLVVALIAASGTFGVRRAQAQVDDAQQKVAERKLAEEQSVAAQRQDELAKLRAEQEQLLAQLKMLEAEKEQIQLQLKKARDIDVKVAETYVKQPTIEEKLSARRAKELSHELDDVAQFHQMHEPLR